MAFSCGSRPCAAPLTGYVATTTAAGVDPSTGTEFNVGERVFGPFFETGLSSGLERLGCAPGQDAQVPGGVDTQTAEQLVAQQCNVSLPRYDPGYVGLLGPCGDLNASRFHERSARIYCCSAPPACERSARIYCGSAPACERCARIYCCACHTPSVLNDPVSAPWRSQ
jgi:hypothetical protein|eukprot:510465-Prymnesium_polylepis.1